MTLNVSKGRKTEIKQKKKKTVSDLIPLTDDSCLEIKTDIFKSCLC